MIIQLRVDDRLVHGQVALVWTRELNASGIVVANNEAAENEITQMTLKMAAPTGKKLLIRSVEDTIKVLKNPKSKEMRLLVLTNCISDAYEICKQVVDISVVNIANVGRFDKTDKTQMVRLNSALTLNSNEISALKKISELEHVEVYSQGLPSSNVVKIEQLLEGIT